MIAALEQSGGAWLPVLHAEQAPDEARDAAQGSARLLLDAGGEPMAGLLQGLAAPCVVAIGPEGGLEAHERAAFLDAGWRAASIGTNVLRFETAGIAALSVLRAHLRQAV
jgi:16S rRNA (uracil1498-N3)-methyltransferase